MSFRGTRLWGVGSSGAQGCSPEYLSSVPGIRQLQLILLKVALLLGVEVHINVRFEGLVAPTGKAGTVSLQGGWRSWGQGLGCAWPL